MDLRVSAREVYTQTLSRLSVRGAFRRKVHREVFTVSVENRVIDLTRFTHVVLIAVGKAAVPMTTALLETLDPIPEFTRLEGIVVAPTVPARPHRALSYRQGSHPLPDAASRKNAADVLELLGRCGSATVVFFLVSGGSSAMLDLALDPSLTPESAVAFHQYLVHSGLPIAEMNMLRKHVSSVKGGRLAVAAGEATMCTLLISDVPPGTPEVIGSGMSLPDSSSVEDCRRLLRLKLADAPLPAAIRAWFADEACPETPKPAHPAFRKATWHTLLSSDDLCEAAGELARSLGFHVVFDSTCDEWDYRDAADYLLNRVSELAKQYSRLCLISAGELAVSISGTPGVGGRNQQFALECARLLAERGQGATVLSAGSDGVDGNSPAAGAVVDETTAGRAAAEGLPLESYLRAFNAYPLLKQLGDTIHTGPSGNNLRDLRLLLSVKKT